MGQKKDHTSMGARRSTPAGLRLIALAAVGLLAMQPGLSQGQSQAGRTSGLPVPRFVSLDADPVNVRFGPGRQYPVNWVFAREGLPVMIVAEFDNWRKIRDHEGKEGWIHSSLLSSRRTFMVSGQIRELHRTASEGARVVLRAEPGVVGDLLNCEGEWCHVEIEGRRGWLQRSDFWGVLPDEVIG
jgi:SH3-like domain-containing protein